MKTAPDNFAFKDWLRLIAVLIWLAIFVLHPRLTLTVTFLIIGSIVITFNGMVFWLSVIRGENSPAAAPILGGFIAAAGIAILPIEDA